MPHLQTYFITKMRLLYIIILTIVSFYSIPLSAQSTEELYRNWGEAIENDDTIAVFSIYHAIGDSYWQQKDTMNYLHHLLYIYELYLHNNPIEDTLKTLIDSVEYLGNLYDIDSTNYIYSRLWNYKGNRFKDIGRFDEALNIFNKCLLVDTLILAKNPNGPDSITVGGTYQGIGAIYNEKGDYKRAIEYFEKALHYLEGKNEKETANVYHNLGYSLSNLGENDSAKSYYQDAADIRERYPEKGKFLNSLIGACEDNISCLAKLLSKVDNENLERRARLEQIYSNQSLKNGDLETAQEYAQSALAKRLTYHEGRKHHQVGISHKRLGIIADSMSKHQEALQHYQKALVAIVWDFNDSTDISKNPSLEQDINSKVELLGVLQAKAYSLQLNKQLELALETYELMFDLIDDMRLNYVADASTYRMLEEVSPTYEQAIELSIALDQKEKAFEFIARSKSAVLVEGLRDLNAKYAAQIPRELLDEERTLKINIAHYERELFNAKRDKNNTNIQYFQKQRFDEQQRYFAFLEQLESDYPAYYKRKYETEVASVASLQATLEDSTAILEFFQGEEHIYAALITKDGLRVFNVPLEQGFEEQLNNFLAVLDTNDTDKATFKTFSEAGYQLYQQLFSGMKIPATIKKLKIIPDKQLAYLPFQALIKHPVLPNYKEARYDTLSYLIHDYQFSYAYASTLLVEKRISMCDAPSSIFGGFAPLFDNSPSQTRNGQQLGQLLASMKEVQQIAALLDGQIYMDTTATKANFISHVSEHSILHLATHANLNALDPMESEIHFIDTSLTTREIYNLPLCAKLAVLSACETGTGELKKGEGIMSLARAFAQAGCPSLVASLWQVNDKRTTEIMFDFYNALKAGKSKSKALHQAQTNYLSNIDIYSEAHPHYWAAFVMIGDVRPVFATPFSWKWGVSVLLLLLLFLGFWLLKRST